MINKGYYAEDRGYIYTCRLCGGQGYTVPGDPCPHCYALVMSDLLREFQMARGERYYAILKAILSLVGKGIIDDARWITRSQGHLLISDVVLLMVKYDWPFNRTKAFFEWLEERGVCPFGMYDALKDRGFSIGKYLETFYQRPVDGPLPPVEYAARREPYGDDPMYLGEG